MNDNFYRMIALVIFLSGAAISSYYRRKADRQGGKVSLKDEGLAITLALRLFGLALWVCVFAWLIHPAWLDWARLDLPEWARWLGLAMGALASGLVYWVMSNLGENVTPTVATRSEARLVTSGPYRWVRHPLYTIGMISYLGFSLLAENWLIALLAVLAFIVLMLRTPNEEAHLVEKFGEPYTAYMQRTGRYLPRLWR